MARREWLALVAVHSDAWLLSVAFYYGARLDGEGRAQLFKTINDGPTLFEARLAAQPPSTALAHVSPIAQCILAGMFWRECFGRRPPTEFCMACDWGLQ